MNTKPGSPVNDVCALTAQQLRRYKEDGFVVLRGVFQQDEVDRAAKAAIRCVTGDHVTTAGDPYPSRATLYVLERHHVEVPEFGHFSSHPIVLDSVQTLLGCDAVMSTAVTYVKTPGAAGTGGDYQGSHPTAHQDYKT